MAKATEASAPAATSRAAASATASRTPSAKVSQPSVVPPTEMTGAQALIRSLELSGATEKMHHQQ